MALYSICIAWTLLTFFVSQKGSSSSPPILVWPLGEDIGITEVLTNTTIGSLHNVTYISGPINLDYKSISFTGDEYSYADYPIPYEGEFNYDYTLRFYINLDAGGTILHFVSNYPNNEFFKSIKLGVNSTMFVATMCDNVRCSEQITSITLVNTVWYCLNFVRDKRETYYLAIDNTVYLRDVEFENWVKEASTFVPGNIRIGSDQNNTAPFSGSITCMQVIPGKLTGNEYFYDENCQTKNWPISQPAQISTQGFPSTLYIQSSFSASFDDSYMSASSPLPTSMSTLTLDTTLAPITVTSSTAILSSTSMPGIMPTSVVSVSPQQTLRPANPPQSKVNTCFHYKRYSNNSYLKNSSDIIDTFSATSVFSCTMRCNNHCACKAFAFDALSCWLVSTSEPETIYQYGITIYVKV